MNALRRLSPVPWLKAHPFAADAMLAGLLALVSLLGLRFRGSPEPDARFRDPDVLAVVLVLAQCLPLAWRRRRPGDVLLVTGLASIAFGALGYATTSSGLGVLIALYSVAAHSPRREALISLGVTAVGILAARVATREEVPLAAFVSNYVIFATAWILGDNLRNRRAYVAELEHRAERLEREREEEARRAVESERARIARELHDVVAHSVSVMVVQAGGARRVLERRPDQAREALCNIEDTGRNALQEMRRLLGVLRHDDGEAAERAPQPGVASVDDLVRQVREAGLAVDVVVEGEPRPLASGVDLSAYRIVQEALTNVMKHAGPARAEVYLCYGEGVLELWVRDDGRGAGAVADANGIAAGGDQGKGHGLVGMRERVALFGGELRAGPRPGGGFEVRARLPLEPAPSAARP